MTFAELLLNSQRGVPPNTSLQRNCWALEK